MALEEGEGSVSLLGRSLPAGKTQYPLYRRLRGAPGPVSTGAENLATTRFRSPNRPARSQSLYRLRYPANLCTNKLYLLRLTQHRVIVVQSVTFSFIFLYLLFCTLHFNIMQTKGHYILIISYFARFLY